MIVYENLCKIEIAEDKKERYMEKEMENYIDAFATMGFRRRKILFPREEYVSGL